MRTYKTDTYYGIMYFLYLSTYKKNGKVRFFELPEAIIH